ncbi:hypothetical protein HYH03_007232 [Edaphochlamys debaryana]|uniref:histidine kinase n=1 Tax=Edaphochlamys debaryana TaxID=47281 RepID=A0A835Y2H5_9CHLO|nr:hypothetical protein HYH03_007232 [Edaphochlamys debaryana]|eukprot:KAG2494718.1 hypothetical protein HYH03_007232 [Edaphochlamys debaryana]
MGACGIGTFVASTALNVFITLLLRTQEPGNDNTLKLSAAVFALHLLAVVQLVVPSGVYVYLQWAASAPVLWWLLSQLLATMPPGSTLTLTSQRLRRCVAIESGAALIGLALMLTLESSLVRATVGLVTLTGLGLELLPLVAPQLLGPLASVLGPLRGAGFPPATASTAQAASSTQPTDGARPPAPRVPSSQPRPGVGAAAGAAGGVPSHGVGMPAPMEVLVGAAVGCKLLQAVAAAAIGSDSAGHGLSLLSGTPTVASVVWSLSSSITLYALPLAVLTYYGSVRYAALMLLTARRSAAARRVSGVLSAAAAAAGLSAPGGGNGGRRLSSGGGPAAGAGGGGSAAASGDDGPWRASAVTAGFGPPSSRRTSAAFGPQSTAEAATWETAFGKVPDLGELYRITEGTERSSSTVSDHGSQSGLRRSGSDLALVQLLYIARTTMTTTSGRASRASFDLDSTGGGGGEAGTSAGGGGVGGLVHPGMSALLSGRRSMGSLNLGSSRGLGARSPEESRAAARQTGAMACQTDPPPATDALPRAPSSDLGVQTDPPLEAAAGEERAGGVREVVREVPVVREVIKEVIKEVIVEVPKEVIREVIKEVPVIKEVIREVRVEVPVPTAALAAANASTASPFSSSGTGTGIGSGGGGACSLLGDGGALSSLLAALREHSSDIAHDMKNPLNGVLALSQNVLQGTFGDLPQAAADQLGVVRACAYHILNMINQLRDCLKMLHGGDPEHNCGRVQLSNAVDEVLKRMAPMVGNRLQVRSDADPTITAYADDSRLYQTVHTVLANAFKYTRRGSVTVETAVNPDRTAVTLRVLDTGTGFSAEQIDKYNSPLTGSPTEQLGLGLTMVKRTMALFGGLLRIGNRPPSSGSSGASGGWVELVFRAREEVPAMGMGLPSIAPMMPLPSPSVSGKSTSGPDRTAGPHAAGRAPDSKPDKAEAKGAQPPKKTRKSIMGADRTALEERLAQANSSNEAGSRSNATSRASAFPGRSSNSITGGAAAATAAAAVAAAGGGGGSASGAMTPVSGGVLDDALVKDGEEGVRVLIVDDDPVNLTILEDLLRSEGYDVLTAGNGTEALEVYLTSDPQPKLVLLDVTLPDLSGHEVCLKMRSLTPGVPPPIIMISGKASTKDVIKGLQAGACDYITKPFQPQEVMARVETQLRLFMGEVAQLQEAAERNMGLLRQILPPHILASLRGGTRVLVEKFNDVVVLCADVVGFSALAAAADTADCITTLNRLFSTFDALTDKMAVHKMDCHTDSYVAALGHMPQDRHISSTMQVKIMLELAREMLAAVDSLPYPDTLGKMQIRVGLHVGTVYGGVIGIKYPRYSLFGTTLRLAQGLQATALPNSVHVTEVVHNRVRGAGGESFTPYTTSQVQSLGIIRTYLASPFSNAGPEGGPLQGMLDFTQVDHAVVLEYLRAAAAAAHGSSGISVLSCLLNAAGGGGSGLGGGGGGGGGGLGAAAGVFGLGPATASADPLRPSSSGQSTALTTAASQQSRQAAADGATAEAAAGGARAFGGLAAGAAAQPPRAAAAGGGPTFKVIPVLGSRGASGSAEAEDAGVVSGGSQPQAAGSVESDASGGYVMTLGANIAPASSHGDNGASSSAYSAVVSALHHPTGDATSVVPVNVAHLHALGAAGGSVASSASARAAGLMAAEASSASLVQDLAPGPSAVHSAVRGHGAGRVAHAPVLSPVLGSGQSSPRSSAATAGGSTAAGGSRVPSRSASFRATGGVSPLAASVMQQQLLSALQAQQAAAAAAAAAAGAALAAAGGGGTTSSTSGTGEIMANIMSSVAADLDSVPEMGTGSSSVASEPLLRIGSGAGRTGRGVASNLSGSGTGLSMAVMRRLGAPLKAASIGALPVNADTLGIVIGSGGAQTTAGRSSESAFAGAAGSGGVASGGANSAGGGSAPSALNSPPHFFSPGHTRADLLQPQAPPSGVAAAAAAAAMALGVGSPYAGLSDETRARLARLRNASQAELATVPSGGSTASPPLGQGAYGAGAYSPGILPSGAGGVGPGLGLNPAASTSAIPVAADLLSPTLGLRSHSQAATAPQAASASSVTGLGLAGRGLAPWHQPKPSASQPSLTASGLSATGTASMLASAQSATHVRRRPDSVDELLYGLGLGHYSRSIAGAVPGGLEELAAMDDGQLRKVGLVSSRSRQLVQDELKRWGYR